MIYLFAGDDTSKKIIAYEKFLQTEFSGVDILFINRNNFNEQQLESLCGGSGLFFEKCVVVFESMLEREEMKDYMLSKLPSMQDSPNAFVFIENKLNKPVLDVFKKARAELDIFELSKEKKEKFNNFLLANAFGDRDKFRLWLYFRQARDVGVGMEELTGVLFWKAKDMILKKQFSKFKEKELQNFANKISYLLPEARKNGVDDEASFERFLLEIL